MADHEASVRMLWGSNAAEVVAKCARFTIALTTVAFVAVVACGHANAATCENEMLRSELGSSVLPECRAYEMISPPYKDGQPLFMNQYASDGEKVIVHSLGGIADIQGSGEAATDPDWYLSSRTPDGWRLSAMNPPLTEFVGQVPEALEAGSGMSLWAQHTPQQSVNTLGLYVRSEGGIYTLIGPLNPHAVGEQEESDFIYQSNQKIAGHAIAATNSYEHIVIRAAHPEAHWPFDKTTGEESLYEYSGVNNKQPVLLEAMGVKGSTELIASCGAALGSAGSESTDNALTWDGEAIFFTVEPCSGKPATAEIYARLHGALTSATPAETVDVSEPECAGAECEAESGKNFEGASENGEKVFFTSTQKLAAGASDLTAGGSATEGEGCERTAGGCNLYEYNFALPPHERLSLVAGGSEDVRGVAGIAGDGSRVYFVAYGKIAGSGENQFHHAPLDGKPNLYVYDTEIGTTSFVATLSPEEDERDWAREYSRPVDVAGKDGQFLLFASSAPGVTADEASGGIVQLFEYDAETGELVRVTQGEEGYNGNGNGVTRGLDRRSIAGRATRIQTDFHTAVNVSNLIDDGKMVVFETSGELSPRAAPAASVGCTSVYEFRSEKLISEGAVHLLSDGQDVQPYKGITCGAQFSAMDATGQNILIATDDPLLTSDVDGVQQDIYDMRVDGGFPPGAQGQETGLCVADACDRNEGRGPGPIVPGSATQNAEGVVPVAPTVAGTSAQPTSKTLQQVRKSKSGELGSALRTCRSERTRKKVACQRRAKRRFAPRKSSRKDS